jgi:hypothetical protein
MLKEKSKAPPLYIPGSFCEQFYVHHPVYAPSSGVMVRVKFRRSEGSGKLVFMVGGRSSSVRSEIA